MSEKCQRCGNTTATNRITVVCMKRLCDMCLQAIGQETINSARAVRHFLLTGEGNKSSLILEMEILIKEYSDRLEKPPA